MLPVKTTATCSWKDLDLDGMAVFLRAQDPCFAPCWMSCARCTTTERLDGTGGAKKLDEPLERKIHGIIGKYWTKWAFKWNHQTQWLIFQPCLICEAIPVNWWWICGFWGTLFSDKPKSWKLERLSQGIRESTNFWKELGMKINTKL